MYFRSLKKTALDVPISEPIETDKEGNTLTLMDIIATEDTILDDLDTAMNIARLRRYILNLSEREQKILTLRYGIGGESPLTQREVAGKLGISRSYVSRIEKKTLADLKNMFDNEQ